MKWAIWAIVFLLALLVGLIVLVTLANPFWCHVSPNPPCHTRLARASVAPCVAPRHLRCRGPKQSPALGGALQAFRVVAAAGLEPATRGLWLRARDLGQSRHRWNYHRFRTLAGWGSHVFYVERELSDGGTAERRSRTQVWRKLRLMESAIERRDGWTRGMRCTPDWFDRGWREPWERITSRWAIDTRARPFRISPCALRGRRARRLRGERPLPTRRGRWGRSRRCPPRRARVGWPAQRWGDRTRRAGASPN